MSEQMAPGYDFTRMLATLSPDVRADADEAAYRLLADFPPRRVDQVLRGVISESNGLVDDDIDRVAKGLPSNLVSADKEGLALVIQAKKTENLRNNLGRPAKIGVWAAGTLLAVTAWLGFDAHNNSNEASVAASSLIIGAAAVANDARNKAAQVRASRRINHRPTHLPIAWHAR